MAWKESCAMGLLCLAISLQMSLSSSFDEGQNISHFAAAILEGSNVPVPVPQPARFRRKRSQNKNVRGLSEEEKRIAVETHNAMRGNQRSSNMRYMKRKGIQWTLWTQLEDQDFADDLALLSHSHQQMQEKTNTISDNSYWNNNLETLAQNWAENCHFDHRPLPQRKKIDGFGIVGENIWAGSGGYDIKSMIQNWYDEIKYYNYDTFACSRVCTHYTQVVWARTHDIGCGLFYCPILTNVRFKKGWFFVCSYGPAGNYRYVKPFKLGPSCSQCSTDAANCVGGLCSKHPVAARDTSAASIIHRFQLTATFTAGCVLVTSLLQL